jgi:hypothetical protein
MWISPEFKIYLVKEFQRLKDEEQRQLGWSAKRELAKINYRIHTDAIKENLIPAALSPAQCGKMQIMEVLLRIHDGLKPSLSAYTVSVCENSVEFSRKKFVLNFGITDMTTH